MSAEPSTPTLRACTDARCAGGDVDPDQVAAFRSGFRQLAASVGVVTTGGWRPAGFTATSITSVSLDPVLVSFNVNRSASSWPAVERADHVGVHLLHSGQRDIAAAFATSGIDRFAAVRQHWSLGSHGLPLLDDYLVRLVAQVHDRVAAGDSTLVIARVLELDHRVTDPLVYRGGGYAQES